LRLVRLPRDLTVLVGRIDLDLQSLPGVLPGAAVSLDTEARLELTDRVRPGPAVLDDMPSAAVHDRLVRSDDVTRLPGPVQRPVLDQAHDPRARARGVGVRRLPVTAQIALPVLRRVLREQTERTRNHLRRRHLAGAEHE